MSNPTPCHYVREAYGVPAEIGRRVSWNGKPGTIYQDGGCHVAVNFDEDKAGICYQVHPTDPGLEYLEMGKIRKMTRSQSRYQEFIRADWFDGTFGEWIGAKSHV